LLLPVFNAGIGDFGNFAPPLTLGGFGIFIFGARGIFAITYFTKYRVASVGSAVQAKP